MSHPYNPTTCDDHQCDTCGLFPHVSAKKGCDLCVDPTQCDWETRAITKVYQDGNSILYVFQGITSKRGQQYIGKWFTVRKKPGEKHNRRCINYHFPVRDAFEEAQADLDAWAQKRGLVEIIDQRKEVKQYAISLHKVRSSNIFRGSS